jgi:PAS domain S-box-containing protein
MAKSHRFSLRCGYPITGFYREEHSDPFLKICAEHSEVIPSEPYTDLKTEEKRLENIAHLQYKAHALEYEVALRQSEERFRLFVDAVRGYAIFMLDPEGRVLTWNSGAQRIKGYEASEIIGQHFSCFYPEEDVRARKPQWELEVAAREGRLEDEGWRVRKDGSQFWANVIITALRDEKGNLVGFGKVTRDFTERMRTQEALRKEIVERVEAQKKLHESEKSLRKLSLHLLRTQDEERRRIGRELHDSLGQYLSVLKMKIDSLNRSSDKNTVDVIRQDIGECAKLAEEAIKEVRTISYLLYPPMLEEMGLKSAVPWYLDGFSRRSGIKTTFQIPSDFARLAPDVELAMFRVLQESLTNVHRHSGSPSATVRLLLHDGAAVLEVTDKGKGIPAAILEETRQDWMGALGVGLRGMTERLRQLGGTLELSSNPEGTTVRASVPVEAIAARDDSQLPLELESGKRSLRDSFGRLDEPTHSDC